MQAHLGSFEIDEYVVVVVNSVGECVRIPSSPLEVFATDEATIDIDVGQRDRAYFLKVEVQYSSVNLCRE